MDEHLANTQEVHPIDVIINPINIWGRFLAIGKDYVVLNAVKDKYTFGRSADVTFCSTVEMFNTISKIHFEISRENQLVKICDRSQNGTFLNGKRIEKDRQVILQSNVEIAISSPSNVVYKFCNMHDQEEQYPEEVTSKYTIDRKLGSGACGVVMLAYCNDTCNKVAVKIITKKTFNVKQTSANIKTEVEILRSLEHPCIIKFIEAIETKDELYIVLEYAGGGELFERVVKSDGFSESNAKVWFYQLLLAIQYLHNNNVSHRDLKPENILLIGTSNTSLLKITDFGLSKFLDGKTMLKTLCGTPNYLAPEVLLSEGGVGYTFACDIWSLGVILFICLASYPPFTDERSDMPLRDQILKGSVSFPRHFWKDISMNAIMLVKSMLIVNPKRRITIDQILQHSWLQDEQMKATVHSLMYPLAAVTTPVNEEPAVLDVPAQSPVLAKTAKSTQFVQPADQNELVDLDEPVQSILTGEPKVKRHRRQ